MFDLTKPDSSLTDNVSGCKKNIYIDRLDPAQKAEDEQLIIQNMMKQSNFFRPHMDKIAYFEIGYVNISSSLTNLLTIVSRQTETGTSGKFRLIKGKNSQNTVIKGGIYRVLSGLLEESPI